MCVCYVVSISQSVSPNPHSQAISELFNRPIVVYAAHAPAGSIDDAPISTYCRAEPFPGLHAGGAATGAPTASATTAGGQCESAAREGGGRCGGSLEWGVGTERDTGAPPSLVPLEAALQLALGSVSPPRCWCGARLTLVRARRCHAAEGGKGGVGRRTARVRDDSRGELEVGAPV